MASTREEKLELVANFNVNCLYDVASIGQYGQFCPIFYTLLLIKDVDVLTTVIKAILCC